MYRVGRATGRNWLKGCQISPFCPRFYRRTPPVCVSAPQCASTAQKHSSELGVRFSRPPDSNSNPDPEKRPGISDQEWEIRTGRAIYLLQQTLPEFFHVGLVTSIDRETGTPRPASPSIPVLNANPLDVQTYIDEDNETIYSPKVRLSYTPPVALPPPFPATLHIEGLPLYLASSVFIRHTLNALYSDLNVELRKVIVKTPRSKESVSGEVTFEEPKAPLQEVRRERDKRLLVGFCVTGKSRVSGARGQWEVNSTYSFSPNTGLIDRHVIDSIYPPPHQAVYDSLRMSLGKVFGFGIEEGSQARSNSAACSASSGIPGGDRNGKQH